VQQQLQEAGADETGPVSIKGRAGLKQTLTDSFANQHREPVLYVFMGSFYYHR
jgi:hypothetical protein